VVIPATQFTPDVDPPPTPAQPTAQLQADNTIKINWTNAGDTSSYAYLIQRAKADASGNPGGSFTTIAQVFSGPTKPGEAGASAWGDAHAASGEDPDEARAKAQRTIDAYTGA